MAKGSIDVLKDRIDIDKVIKLLNMALSEEWLAFYQYWVGSFVIKGMQRSEIEKEFIEHAMEEYHHAELLANRIIELEGTPVLSPKEWFDLAQCSYDAPLNEDVVEVLKQNIKAERCAINRYQMIAEYTHGKDFTTCDLAKLILREEEEHDQELQDYLDDIFEMKDFIGK